MESSKKKTSSLLHTTGVMEGFYRRWGSGGAAGRSVSENAVPSSPLQQTSSAEILSRRSFTAPLVESMERPSDPPPNSSATSVATGTGDSTPLNSAYPSTGSIGGAILMPPGELGLALAADSMQSPTAAQLSRCVVASHPSTIRARQRTLQAIRRGSSVYHLSVAASVDFEEQDDDYVPKQSDEALSDISKLTALCYRGVEVIFGTTGSNVYGMCARTQLVFQTLDLPESSSNVIGIWSMPETGQIVVAQANGSISTFLPQVSDPTLVAFGRYRWGNGPAVPIQSVFYTDKVFDLQGERLDVSLSQNYKILVAHKTQLAVFDAAPNHYSENSSEADLLWTTRLHGRVVTAKIAGDGEAIALVLEETDRQEAEVDGVHTFERDHNDGSDDVSSSMPVLPDLSKSRLVRAPSVGLVYKPGPFLVHAAPVTQLSFRGQGHTTSNVDKSKEEGCDLLLTYSGGEHGIARIFNQNKWKALTEWRTPHKTRVDWIRGAPSFALGDLERGSKRKKPVSSTPISRVTSGQSLPEMQAVSDRLGKRNNNSYAAAIPSHSAPSSNSGAWIAEVSFHTPIPSIRVSRLTYLKRGVDDLEPTLFENVSAFLPAGFVGQGPVLSGAESTFCVQGVWPIWKSNPKQSNTTSDNTTFVISNETLRGSAMSYLGLNSTTGGTAVTAGGGQFGDTGFGSAQSPPSEIRVMASHPTSGKMVVLEFPMMIDPEWNALELGNPRKSVLALDQVESDQSAECIASTDYEASRLEAEVDTKTSSIVVTWRKQGTLSLLPAKWLPDDANPSATEKLLEEKRSFKDDSLVPAPLALPNVSTVTLLDEGETILSLMWWLDDHFGGPPLLVVVTNSGRIVVYELPPPWSCQDPVKLRMDGPLPDSHASTNHITVSLSRAPPVSAQEKTYEVLITPDPEYGLGLRLEVQTDGQPAVAGSYKNHPLTGETLPAEKTGMISLGDELIAANDVSLEHISFDDIIATVRDIGSQCGPNSPMRLTFRRPSAPLSPPSPPQVISAPQNSPSHGRRNVMGVKAYDGQSNPSPKPAERVPERKASKENEPELLQTFVVGHFQHALEKFDSDEMQSYLIPFNESDKQRARRADRSAIVVLSRPARLSMLMLTVDSSHDPKNARVVNLGNWSVPGSEVGRVLRPDIMEVVTSTENRYHILASDDKGMVYFIVAEVDARADSSMQPGVSFRYHEIMQFQEAPPCLSIRACGIELLATMKREKDTFGREIQIWSARPHPGCPLVPEPVDSSEVAITSDYASEIITAECLSSADAFIDFLFVHSGYLDAFPCLLVLLRTQTVLFCKDGGSSCWLPSIQISHNSLAGSLSFNSSTKVVTSTPHAHNPRRSFPNIITMVQLAISSRDEQEYLRTDWDPESVIAHLFTDERGARESLEDRVRFLFLWLCSEGNDIPEGYLDGPLVVAPLPIVEVKMHSGHGDERKGMTDAGLMSPNETTGGTESIEDRENLKKLKEVLSRSSSLKADDKDEALGEVGPSLSATMTMELPTVLKTTDADDLSILCGICGLLIDPPNYKGLDKCGQHFMLSWSILDKLRPPRSPGVGTGASSLGSMSMPSFSTPPASPTKRISSRQESVLKAPQVASSACLAGLLCNMQGDVIDRCKQIDRRLDWEYARELRLPFWVRSDTFLAKLSEEIGQNIFREKRDIMECALFFIIARKMRTLRNLAATDRSDSGVKFFNFLTSYDFSSEKGRRAAEKNAFSLLRKCQYRIAAAFFLLGDPPSLTSAVETIATKLQDLDLAFLVVRLMESSDVVDSTVSLSSAGGFLGGGGGFAGPGIPSQPVVSESDFSDWKPKLKEKGRKLVVDRMLPISVSDNAMTAVKLLWMGKSEEAAWCLTRVIEVQHDRETSYSLVPHTSNILQLPHRRPEGGPRSWPLDKANVLIDFMSTPSLLVAMRASHRARVAGTFIVAQTLTAKGIEVPSIHACLQSMNEVDDPPPEDSSMTVTSRVAKPSATVQFSIFDEFDVPAPAKPGTGGTTPSPFGFARLPADSTTSTATQKSIFDDFEVPVPPIHHTTSSATASVRQPQSSSLDTVEAPARKASAPTMHMQSSIFDVFDAPAPPKPVVPQSSSIQPSIFDAFDPPTQAVKAKQDSTYVSSNQKSSSVFDSFDPSPATKCSISTSSPSNAVSSEQNGNETTAFPSADVPLTLTRQETPKLWTEWSRNLLESTAARRLLREVASVIAQFDGDPADPSIEVFYRSDDPLVPSGAAGILQIPCDADHILGRVEQSLEELCSASRLEAMSVVTCALKLLGDVYHRHRTLFAVVLHMAAGRSDLAEDVLRAAACDLMQFCGVFAFSVDSLFHERRTRFQASSQFLRRRAARMSWQLETCLWLHRGGGLPVSGLALKEAITAVRVGILMASWNHNHECLETMLRSEPDCHLDEEAGRHLWNSLKLITSYSSSSSGAPKTSSGGWEFLVDCRRSDATAMLRDKKTGCFIIRPHTRDHGVFTLSFKTNLVPNAVDNGATTEDVDGEAELSDDGGVRPPKAAAKAKPIQDEDVVQHAIIRLSESGYRCGSFGPFTTLIDLLEAVSASLPFKLRFDLPPSSRVIKEEGSQPSPNAVLLRKLALSHADSAVFSNVPHHERSSSQGFETPDRKNSFDGNQAGSFDERKASFALFLELLVLTSMRKQLCSIVAADYQDSSIYQGDDSQFIQYMSEDECSRSSDVSRTEQDYLTDAARFVTPLLTWTRSLELLAAHQLAPDISFLGERVEGPPVDLAETSKAIEATSLNGRSTLDGGDNILRKMIQRDSGIEFTTLRLVDGAECTLVIMFSKNDAVKWLVSSGLEESEMDALDRLRRMEMRRVIEAIDPILLALKPKNVAGESEGIRYRILDPWEVEALFNWEGETMGASLGRERCLGFNLGKVGLASETVFRGLGGLPVLALWTSTKGGVVLTKALASVHSPWERSSGGDLQFKNGRVIEPPPFENSIRRHLYRNALFRFLKLPQRFLSIIQVELLDLKNLTAPGGSLAMSVYALLRLKRPGSSTILTNKTRTLDTASTQPVKLGKSSGPNAPASWGSVVRFRFPLPEDASVEGVSFDKDRELLFKGPPEILQVSVYERKLLVDHALGTADIRMDGLSAGGQLEEWVPLRSDKHGITWFARVRLTLRFELMCLATDHHHDSRDLATAAPSVGLRKIEALSRYGGTAHEDVKRSTSSPDLLTYFENMVY